VGVTGVTAIASSIVVDVNTSASGTGAVVNYAGTNAQGDLNALDVPTGDAANPSVTLDIDGNNGNYELVQATLDLSIGNDFNVVGNFAFSSKTGQSVALSSGGPATVDEVTFGGSDVSVFIGYNNTANPIPAANSGSVGFEVTGLDFGVAFLSGTGAFAGKSWTSAESHNGSAALIGIPSVTINASSTTTTTRAPAPWPTTARPR
jgi:hypothetical protein